MSRNVIIPAVANQTATIIFLHGLGDTGHGWSSTIESLRPKHAKIICPTAPTMPVTLNFGVQMPSWFDLFSLDANGPVDEQGIENAKNNIHKIINDEEKNGIPSNRIVLGGFSQGGALALYSGLTYTKPLAGILALSCWIPLHNKFPSNFSSDVPTLQLHGDADQIVPLKWGQLSSEFLKKHLKNYQFKIYPRLQHSSCEEEHQDMKKFFQEHLK